LNTSQTCSNYATNVDAERELFCLSQAICAESGPASSQKVAILVPCSSKIVTVAGDNDQGGNQGVGF
jgi:hypothetical protein